MSMNGSSLPPELLELHRELEALEIEERPSFGPELQKELESEMYDLVQRPAPRRATAGRWAMAAAIGGLIAMGTVPGVRASLVKAFDSVRSLPAPTVAETTPPPAPVSVLTEAAPEAAPRTFVPIDETPPSTEASASWVDAPLDALAPVYAYPVLSDPENAERIVQMFYPRRLQETGVGGEIRLMVWVTETGVAEDREILMSSDVDALDRAALSAVGRLRFTPARRGGAPVGSWVKFTVRFEAPDRTGAAEPGSIQESESMVVDAGGSTTVGRPN